MPNRIIKESIRSSEKLASLSDFQFRLWVSLITYVDDYGRGDARPPIIKGAVFPLRESVTGGDIEKGLAALEGAGCIMRYEVAGKPYLCFPSWEAHQRIQTKRSKFPPPLSTVGDGEVRPESESISESISETDDPVCAKQGFAPQADKQKSVFSLPLPGGGEYAVMEEQIKEWAALYPAVDISDALRSMKGWLLANPKRQKTRAGILRFIGAWLAKEQDRGGKPIPKGGGKGLVSGAFLSEVDKFMAWNEAQLFDKETAPKEGDGP